MSLWAGHPAAGGASPPSGRAAPRRRAAPPSKPWTPAGVGQGGSASHQGNLEPTHALLAAHCVLGHTTMAYPANTPGAPGWSCRAHAAQQSKRASERRRPRVRARLQVRPAVRSQRGADERADPKLQAGKCAGAGESRRGAKLQAPSKEAHGGTAGAWRIFPVSQCAGSGLEVQAPHLHPPCHLSLGGGDHGARGALHRQQQQYGERVGKVACRHDGQSAWTAKPSAAVPVFKHTSACGNQIASLPC